MASQASIEFSFKLIDAVQPRRALWDCSIPQSRDKELTGLQWDEVARKLGIGREEAKKKWCLMRYYYRNEFKRIELDKTVGSKSKSKWDKYERLGFLKESTLWAFNCQHKRTVRSNDGESSTSVEIPSTSSTPLHSGPMMVDEDHSTDGDTPDAESPETVTAAETVHATSTENCIPDQPNDDDPPTSSSRKRHLQEDVLSSPSTAPSKKRIDTEPKRKHRAASRSRKLRPKCVQSMSARHRVKPQPRKRNQSQLRNALLAPLAAPISSSEPQCDYVPPTNGENLDCQPFPGVVAIQTTEVASSSTSGPENIVSHRKRGDNPPASSPRKRLSLSGVFSSLRRSPSSNLNNTEPKRKKKSKTPFISRNMPRAKRLSLSPCRTAEAQPQTRSEIQPKNDAGAAVPTSSSEPHSSSPVIIKVEPLDVNGEVTEDATSPSKRVSADVENTEPNSSNEHQHHRPGVSDAIENPVPSTSSGSGASPNRPHRRCHRCGCSGNVTPQPMNRADFAAKVDLERRQVAVLEKILNEYENDDMLFFRSLLLDLQNVSRSRKVYIRYRIQQMIYNELYSDYHSQQ